jgi:hypothetical protein
MHDASLDPEVDVSTTYRSRVPDALFGMLVEEAILVRKDAHRVVSDSCELEPDGAVNGRGRCWIAGPGAKLREFHKGLGLEIARAFSQAESAVFPTRAAYLFYDKGDFSFFHHDAVHAHITIIIGLSDHLLPLVVYPSFTHISTDDIARLNEIGVPGDNDFTERISHEFGHRAISRSVPIPIQHLVAIRGRRVPHAHAPQPYAGFVCTACYSFLQPPRDWTII